MSDRSSKAAAFLALHRPGEPLIMPNIWSAGPAKALEQAGFKAVATTSIGLAHDLGLADGEVGRATSLSVAAAICAAVQVPVSGDLENGFGDAPACCAATIAQAAATGLVGGSIEDATGRPDDPIYPFEAAVERVRAAAASARATGGFVLTARAENFLHGRRDLEDTIARLKAFEAAGADVLFAPGLPDVDAVRAVCAAVTKPVSVAVVPEYPALTVANVAGAGASRISMAGALGRAAHRAILDVANLVASSGAAGHC